MSFPLRNVFWYQVGNILEFEKDLCNSHGVYESDRCVQLYLERNICGVWSSLFSIRFPTFIYSFAKFATSLLHWHYIQVVQNFD